MKKALSSFEASDLKEQHGVTSQKTPFVRKITFLGSIAAAGA
jgi:hypothetical protein